jgi:hypothetical protein
MNDIEKEIREAVLDALVALVVDGYPVGDKGICSHVYDWIYDNVNPYERRFVLGMECSMRQRVYTMVEDVARGWRWHSGHRDYPIPVTDDDLEVNSPFAQFGHAYRGNAMWTGMQGAMRWDLVAYMITKLTNELYRSE